MTGTRGRDTNKGRSVAAGRPQLFADLSQVADVSPANLLKFFWRAVGRAAKCKPLTSLRAGVWGALFRPAPLLRPPRVHALLRYSAQAGIRRRFVNGLRSRCRHGNEQFPFGRRRHGWRDRRLNLGGHTLAFEGAWFLSRRWIPRPIWWSGPRWMWSRRIVAETFQVEV